MNLTDAECVRRCAAGRIEALGLLVERYQQPLRALLRSRLSNAAQVDDVVQDTFLRAYRATSGGDPDRPFFPWLVGIAQRVALEAHRLQRRSGGESLGPQHDGRIVLMRRVTDGHRKSAELDGALLAAIERLVEPYRTTVLLRYVSDCPCALIAEYLAVPVGTITKRLSRAHALLRVALRGAAATRAEV